TSFGPRSKWDDLYFLDFYNGGKVDGLFDIYKIPNNLIYENKVNKKQTLKDQQDEKRRPRLCIKKEIIANYKIKPIAEAVKVW
ncbi:Bsp6I family type II restriction endonuclease, partial [Patescibacteria group bacterium]|nr:Bsp6I family type II restriction endonuclease [Patescibacteria group bacterium]